MKEEIQRHRGLVNELKNLKQQDAANAVEAGQPIRFENNTLYLQYPTPHVENMDARMLMKHEWIIDDAADSLGYKVEIC